MNELEDLKEAIQQGDLERVRAIVDINKVVVDQQDETGATALHYATLKGDRDIVSVLLEHGANINNLDGQFRATPAGWAIEYLREHGGHLAIELDDLAFAIETKDLRWVSRFLDRFPALREGSDTRGKTFRILAFESGDPQIIDLFQ
jgi:ankyrin repeat protein